MRDIREDLRQRLASLREERDAIQAQLKAKMLEIDQYEEYLDGLLALEEKRANPSGVGPPARPRVDPSPSELSSEFDKDILSILSPGKELTHSEIKAEMEAKNWEAAEGKSLGRQIQGTLVSLMKNQQLIETTGTGKWRRRDSASEAAA
jgi:hypothetical protein